jgi:glyoxylase-like metal-dependent hydrolase (beta-lactamase superfamily II)
MLHCRVFTFNQFAENTYVVYDDTKSCCIIDPGCSYREEEKELFSFIEEEKLKPEHLLNTHCHIDHILGNRIVAEKYGLKLEAHRLEADNLRAADVYADYFGIQAPDSPPIEIFLEESDIVRFGETEMKVLFVPGHASGHTSFYHAPSNTLFSGDVLFSGSIGRTDLPGGDYDTLIASMRNKLFTLPDGTRVYSGHGPATTIETERRTNPFFQ